MTANDHISKTVNNFFDAFTACTLEVSEQLGMSQLQVNQLHYLKIIDEHENITFSRMAEILGITKPSVTEIINKLIRLGCINKVQSPDDGRIYYIELTFKGKSIARSRILSENKMIELIQNKLDQNEMKLFIELLGKISG